MFYLSHDNWLDRPPCKMNLKSLCSAIKSHRRIFSGEARGTSRPKLTRMDVAEKD